MKRVKDALGAMGGVITFVVLFGVCNVLPAQRDYDWPSQYLADANAAGWELIDIQLSNSLDLAKPWTFFNRPPVGLHFYRPESVVRRADGMRVVTTLDIYRLQAPVEVSQWTKLVDCQSERAAYLELTQAGRVTATAAPSPSWIPSTTAKSFEALVRAVCAR